MTLADNVMNRLPVGGEFQGYNGDCTEYAYMVCVAAEHPLAPCSAAELNRLTAIAVANHFTTAPSGAMTSGNLASFCTLEHVNFEQHSGGDMISTITQNAGKYALVVQVLNGSLIPGNEGGVNGHAFAVLEYDSNSQNVIIANGDSVNGRAGHLDVINIRDIQNAHPFAVTLIKVSAVNQLLGYFDQISPVEWHLKSNPSIVLAHGMLQYWLDIDGLVGLPTANEDWKLKDVFPGHDIAFQRFERGVEVWDKDKVFDNPPGSGDVYLAHFDDPRLGIVQPNKPPTISLGDGSFTAKIDGTNLTITVNQPVVLE